MSGRRKDNPAPWTRFTGRANAVIWSLPLPRRARVLISQFVYRNPAIPVTRVVETLAALEAAGVRMVVIGGWGIDALYGRELRPHRDLDLVAGPEQIDTACDALGELGYRPWHRDRSPAPLGGIELCRAETLCDGAMRVVELHGADPDQFDLARGQIGGREVTCISAEMQLQAQAGKRWTPDQRARRRVNVEAVKAAIQRDPRAGY